MPVTLAHIAKLQTDPLKKSILMNMLRRISLMEVLPFENISSLRVAGLRWRNLPSVEWRQINEGYTQSYGDVEQVWESVFGMGGDFQFDRVLDKITPSLITDPKQLQIDMKLEALKIQFNNYFINGSPAVDADGFYGLKWRIAQMPTRQTLYFAGSTSAPLDPTASAANARLFFDRLEEMKQYTADGNVGAWLCNLGIKLGFGRVARYLQASGANWLAVTKDTFERDIPTMWGAPIYDVGLLKDQTTEIITNTETAGDAGADSTSIYSVSFDSMNGVTGAQLSEPEVYDPLTGGEMETLPSKMMRLDWWVGLVSMGSYGAARGRNLERPADWT